MKFCLVLAFVALALCSCGCGVNKGGCPQGSCCSYWGCCGNTQDHCGSGARQCVCDCNGTKPCMSTPDPKPEPTQTLTAFCYVRGNWLRVVGSGAYTGSLGYPCHGFRASLTNGKVYYRVHFKGNSSWSNEYSNGAGIINTNKPIDGIMMKTNTGKTLYYQVHLRYGKWLDKVTGYNANDSKNGYAGNLKTEIDGFKAELKTVTPPATGKTIFIGDSRTVGMRDAVSYDSSKTIWSAKVNMGYDWMVSTGVSVINSSTVKNAKIIILMGVNDYAMNSYMDVTYTNYINKKASEWAKSGAKTYYVSVNPVIDSTQRYVKNATIKAFNQKMKSKLVGVTYIDTYNYIINSFNAPDGLHYDKATYQKIYNYILTKI